MKTILRDTSVRAVGARLILLLVGCLGLTLVACSTGASGGGSATDDAQVRRGQALFNATCASCHATTVDTVIVGPSLAGIGERAGGRVPGMDGLAYIHQSILNPQAYTVEGFPENIMPPSYSQTFTPEDIEAIVAYLLTLGK